MDPRYRPSLVFLRVVMPGSAGSDHVLGNVSTLCLATLPFATLYHWAMPEPGRRAPDWEWDEIGLACDLVARNGWQGLPAENLQVIELSQLLRSMSIHPD